AFVAEPHRKNMAGDRSQRRDRRRTLSRDLVKGVQIQYPHGRRHGNIALQRIQKKRESAKSLRARSNNVGRSNVAAALLPNIFLTEKAHQHVSKRNRPKQIGNKGDHKIGNDRHATMSVAVRAADYISLRRIMSSACWLA